MPTITQQARSKSLPINIDPMPLWQALLYFGLPALLFRISIYTGTPALIRLGLPHSNPTVMTTALVAALEFGGHSAAANRFMSTHRYVASRLSASRFSRRFHRVKEHVLLLFGQLAEVWKVLAREQGVCHRSLSDRRV